jgi:hypothetical protein
VSPSPSDRTVAFLRGRYQRHPGAAIGIGLSVLWAIWVIYYIADHRDNVDSFGWFPLVAQTVEHVRGRRNNDPRGEEGHQPEKRVLLHAGRVALLPQPPGEPEHSGRRRQANHPDRQTSSQHGVEYP